MIYAVDKHPESADSTTDISKLPENAGPPTISENLLEWSIDEERALHLAAASGWVQNEEWPLYLTVANSATGFSTNWQMLDDSSFDVVVDAQAGDVIALTAADGHPDQGVATLDLTVPAIVLLEAMFESDTASVAETTEILEIDVVLTHEPTESVSVTYQTIAETASPDHDYVEDSGVLAFAEGETRKTIQIQILDDDRPESDESFRLELDEQQVGLYLGEPSSIDVTIISDEPDIESMTYWSEVAETC